MKLSAASAANGSQLGLVVQRSLEDGRQHSGWKSLDQPPDCPNAEQVPSPV